MKPKAIPSLLVIGVTLLALPVAGADRRQIGAPILTLGVGRDFYNGPAGQMLLHGSTNTWEALTFIDDVMKVRPWLAESWHTPDQGRTWVFRLRPGVRFHDGSPLTSRDAAACLKVIAANPRYDPAGNFQRLKNVTASGREEVVFNLERPCPYFPNLVAYYGSPIVKPDGFDAKGRLLNLIGTGPYQVERIRPGETVELASFSGYWAGEPAYRKAVFKNILDAQTRVMALIAGEISAVADIGGILPEQADDLKAAPGVILKKQELHSTHQLIFNCRRPPFSSRQARLWLAGLVDREGLVRALVQEGGVVAGNPYCRLSSEWNFPFVQPKPGPRPDLDRPAGLRLVILLHGGFQQRLPYLALAQFIQALLAKNGWPAEIKVLEAGAYRQARQRGAYHLGIAPAGFLTADPDYFYSSFVSAGSPFGPGLTDDQMEGLIEAARYEMNPELRRDLYRRLAQLFNYHLPMLPLYHEVSLYAHRDSVAGLRLDAFFRPWLNETQPKVKP
ncbi:MAG: ABC transporter substrate-binding protein [Thermodesulfobacteriota bacterium]